VHKRLAEIVIDAKLADREQVVRAARLAEEQRIPLIAALVRNDGIDELALVAAIRRQVRVPLIDPALVEHDPEALRELPQEVCRRLGVMPLLISSYDTGSRTLQLAMADPTDTMAVAEVEHITGCQVENHLMPLSAIEELVQKAYRAFVTEVMRRERIEAAQPVPRAPAQVHDTHRLVVPDMIADAAPELSELDAAATAQPGTVPFHRIIDEASLELRHRALLELLIQKNIISEPEYEEQIRLLMKRHGGEH
jgi:type IV pilus assembly protein PilB